MILVLVMVGAGVGSALRWLGTRAIQGRLGPWFPAGTLAVNVAGCLLLGAVLAAAADGRLSVHAVALLGTGLCGGLTTFSTFGYEAVRLGEDGGPGRARAVAYVGVSVATGIVAFWLAWTAVSSFS